MLLGEQARVNTSGAAPRSPGMRGYLGRNALDQLARGSSERRAVRMPQAKRAGRPRARRLAAQ
eukprot:221384-Pyramimonas_sp.AAC.1